MRLQSYKKLIFERYSSKKSKQVGGKHFMMFCFIQIERQFYSLIETKQRVWNESIQS
jgi:hypothetical protein